MSIIVSHSQTTFSSFIFGREEKGLVSALYNFCSTNPIFLGIYIWLLIGIKGQKRPIDWWEWCNHPALPAWSKAVQAFYGFYHQSETTHRSPRICRMKIIYVGCSPDRFSCRPNMKEEVVWLHETISTTLFMTSWLPMSHK